MTNINKYSFDFSCVNFFYYYAVLPCTCQLVARCAVSSYFLDLTVVTSPFLKVHNYIIYELYYNAFHNEILIIHVIYFLYQVSVEGVMGLSMSYWIILVHAVILVRPQGLMIMGPRLLKLKLWT